MQLGESSDSFSLEYLDGYYRLLLCVGTASITCTSLSTKLLGWQNSQKPEVNLVRKCH